MHFSLRSRADAEKTRAQEDWGSLTWLAGKAAGNCHELSLARVIIRVGKTNPRHSHPNCAEALYLLKGRLEHSAGAEKVVMDAGDTLVVAAGVAHNALNIGREDADMIVCYSSGQREFRRET